MASSVKASRERSRMGTSTAPDVLEPVPEDVGHWPGRVLVEPSVGLRQLGDIGHLGASLAVGRSHETQRRIGKAVPRTRTWILVDGDHWAADGAAATSNGTVRL